MFTALLKKIFNGNPFTTVTLASIITTAGGYFFTHFDPSKLTPTGFAIYGVVTTVVGALTHHTVVAANKGSGT